MAMEHKAFLFDTVQFTKELSGTIITAGTTNNDKLLISFINENLDDLKSPYSGDELTDDWEEELETEDIQELADFAMTKYYSPDEELGLSYLWDSLLESFYKLNLKYNSEYYILGNAITIGDFTLDPGRMGLGFINAEHISSMHEELLNLQQNFADVCDDNDLDPELIAAFDDIVEIYQEARESNCGLMMTF